MMKPGMKKALAAVLLGAGLCGSGAVLAWGGQCDGTGPHRGMMGSGGQAGWKQLAPEQLQARMAQGFDLRMARLELALALQPEQQPAFAAFKARMSERAQQRLQRIAERPQPVEARTAVERMAQLEKRHAERATELAASREAVSSFYTQLNEAQRTVFDAEFQPMGRMGHMGRSGMRGAQGKDGAMRGMGGKRGEGPRHGHRQHAWQS